jgi:hypothetical protein
MHSSGWADGTERNKKEISGEEQGASDVGRSGWPY